MKKIIFLFLLIFIAGCSSFEKAKEVVTAPIDLIHSGKDEVGAASGDRGIEILFMDKRPPEEVLGNFDIAAGVINYMPYSTNLKVKLTTDRETNEISNFIPLQGTITVEPATYDEETRIVSDGKKIVNNDLNTEHFEARTFSTGQINFNLPYEEEIKFYLEYSYHASPVFHTFFTLCSQENLAPSARCEDKVIDQNELGLDALTFPISIAKIKTASYGTPDKKKLAVKLFFTIVNEDEGNAGLAEGINQNAPVYLEITPLGQNNLKILTCLAATTTRNYKGTNKINFRLEDGEAEIECNAEASFDEELQLDTYLGLKLDYDYTRMHTKTVTIRPFKPES